MVKGDIVYILDHVLRFIKDFDVLTPSRKSNNGLFIIKRNDGIYSIEVNKISDDITLSYDEISTVLSYQKFKNKLKEDENLKVYNRSYKTHFARVKNGLITDTEFNKWKVIAKEKLTEAREGKITNDEFCSFLNEDKIRK